MKPEQLSLSVLHTETFVSRLVNAQLVYRQSPAGVGGSVLCPAGVKLTLSPPQQLLGCLEGLILTDRHLHSTALNLKVRIKFNL